MRPRSSWTFGQVALGAGTFGGIGGTPALVSKGLDVEAAWATMDEAVELGITMFDTAERYASGASEAMIGRWLAERPPSVTHSVRITTKVAPAWMSGRDEPFDTTYITAAVAGCLTRLGVDGVELLMVHGPDDSTPVEDTLVALESLREADQAAHVGACNLDAGRLRIALDAAERLGVIGYEVVQNGYSLLAVDEDTEVQAICVERDLAYTAYSPLGGGALTGKYHRNRPPPPNTRLALRPDGVDELLTPAVHDAIDRLRDAAAERAVSCGALALAWLIHCEAIAALISGPARSAPHLGLAAEALRVELTPKRARRNHRLVPPRPPPLTPTPRAGTVGHTPHPEANEMPFSIRWFQLQSGVRVRRSGCPPRTGGPTSATTSARRGRVIYTVSVVTSCAAAHGQVQLVRADRPRLACRPRATRTAAGRAAYCSHDLHPTAMSVSSKASRAGDCCLRSPAPPWRWVRRRRRRRRCSATARWRTSSAPRATTT